MSNSHQVDREKPLLVDFKQQRATEQIFPNPPLLTSLHSGWSDIHFEQHHQPKHDTCEHCVTMHTISIALSSAFTERWLDGLRKSEYLTQGSVAIIPTGTTHRCLWQEDVKFMFVAVDPTFLKQIGIEVVSAEEIELIPHFATLQDPLILGIVLSLKDQLEPQRQVDHLYIEQLKTTLVIHLLKKYCVTKPKISTSTDGLSKQKLRLILEYIHGNLETEIHLTKLAQIAGISQYYFCQLFKNSVGITPYQYVIQQRIEKAKQMLKNQKIAICDIALACGFANQSHLTKHFRKLTGSTPKNYQQM
ncbi:MAG: AraC family transcriptional regulator [Scytonema sp. PMC 1069.18]|nr:AraC family transcriptional regulator [Scytonema sp. PMC 1069.18]MEC4886442.1 AraC family transcriptional regulator [Scytonema sp. PMC 1070.18]